MKLKIEQRHSGHLPLGALAMLPLFALPIGGWLVENAHVDLGTCSMKALLSIPCLTCGATRATLRLLHGDLLAAIALQPMIIFVYFAVAVWGLVSLGLFAVDKRARLDLGRTERRVFTAALFVVPLVNWGYLIAVGV